MPEEIRYAYRLAPCPAYDVEGTESWLTDLAAEGLILAPDGFCCGFSIFERREPQKIRYRLEAAERAADPLGDSTPPGDEAIAISESLGWRYVTRRGDFYVYASTQPGAREMNTDSAVQALALTQVTRRVRGSVIDIIIELLIWCVFFPFFRGHGQVLITAVNIGTWFWLWGNLLVAWFIVDSFRRAFHLHRLRKRLIREGCLNHEKDWRGTALRHYLYRAAKILLVAAWIVVLLVLLNRGILGTDETPLANYAGDPPFATLADLAPEGEHTYKPMFDNIGNTVRVWSDWLAPVNYAWDEIAQVKNADGTALEGSLYIDYHETAAPWIARTLAKEYHRTARWDFGGRYELLDVDLPDVDYAVAFSDSIHLPTVVLQKGSRVIHATLHQYGDDAVPMEEWAARLAECLD